MSGNFVFFRILQFTPPAKLTAVIYLVETPTTFYSSPNINRRKQYDISLQTISTESIWYVQFAIGNYTDFLLLILFLFNQRTFAGKQTYINPTKNPELWNAC